MNSNTASLKEVIALAVNIVGILLVMRLVYTTRLQYNSSLSRFTGNRLELQKLAAKRNFRCEVSRIFVHVFFIALDMCLIYIPDFHSLFYMIFIYGHILVSIRIAFASYLDLRSEKKMTELMR